MATFNRFGNMIPSNRYQEKPYLLALEPFKIMGNLFYVGNLLCSCHLIDTGEGLIILDTPPADQLPYLLDSIWRAGFDPKDIKHIIVSHAHVDHYGSVRALVHISGAKTFLSEVDARDMRERPDFFKSHTKSMGSLNETFVPDVELEDGQVIELGNTKVRCVLTPGHTAGTMSHFWEVGGNEKKYRVGIYGGAGFVTLSPRWWKDDEESFRAMRAAFSASIDKVRDEEVDIMLGNHPFHNDLLLKRRRFASGDKNAFVDREDWTRFLNELRIRYQEFCAMTQEQIDKMFEKSGFEQYEKDAHPYA